ncbi:uncharacterized protein Bfra_005201 [Botrytis fragariae]|uniref:Uncharacterized protein n=1 Tax=Botrytis fragariae TaxID=1964551 RepID=A0A8H6EIQ7_9HELO|nr:uncharacterized protein Bfra_005201 [Botrytis fragariae]KAF5873737.1 hypothetical protein Bfra_005201 [Botrytis fragariae]
MYHREVKRMLCSVAFVLSISTIIKAQTLIGCDSVNCVTQYNPPTCPINNITLSVIGITSFNTSADSSPFTWTLGIQESEETVEPSVPTTHLKHRQTSSSPTGPVEPTATYSFNITLSRDFYLGTPPTVNLTSESNTHACALFFDGIASNLTFGTSATGTCNDALTASCVNDLLAQSQSQMAKILSSTSNTRNETVICNTLQSAIKSQAPASWLSSPISPPSTPKSPDCIPTTGENYELSLIHNTTSSSIVDVAHFALLSDLARGEFYDGITPILTILWNVSSSNDTSSITASAESHLSCLKVVESTNGEIGGDTSSPPKSEGSIMGINRHWSWGLVTVIWGWIVFC